MASSELIEPMRRMTPVIFADVMHYGSGEWYLVCSPGAGGACVLITGRTQSKLNEAVKQVGSNATGAQGDVAKLADLNRFFQPIKKEKGEFAD